MLIPDLHPGGLGPPIDGIAPGTRVDTPLGEVAAEALREGDPVLLAGGGVGVIGWIGRIESRLLPVRIAAGALGGGRPRRDLLLAPDQAVLLRDEVGDLLVRCRKLVNLTSIARQASGAPAYLQIALRDGACLLAEGAAIRAADAPQDVVAMPGDRRPEVVERGERLVRVGRAIDRKAGGSLLPLRGFVGRIDGDEVVGWAIDRADPDRAVTLELVIDGDVIDTAVADQKRPDLASTMGFTACGFRLRLPTGRRGLHEMTLRRAGDGAMLHGATLLLGAGDAAPSLPDLLGAIDLLRAARPGHPSHSPPLA